jgi:signal recognition particle receptor subunit beta
LALILHEQQQLLLRIVYDGPARAGKTTTLRALAEILGRPVRSSESPRGRTLHFDWMEHQGGRFGELAVRCQVLTVPGQRVYEARRRALLAEADAVVFVVGSRRQEIDLAVRSLAILRDQLAGTARPHPGVLVQANKRDLPQAIPIPELHQRLGLDETIGSTASIASQGDGVLQPFVMAVRLALDRVDELLRQGRVSSGAESSTTAEALLNSLDHLAPTRPLAEAMSSAPSLPPGLPRLDAPPGWVWPPVEGRLSLLDAARHEVSIAAEGGDCRGEAGPWMVHAAGAARYEDEASARLALLEWARWHADHDRYLSPGRCLAIAEAPAEGGLQLWQFVRRERTLTAQLSHAIQQEPPEELARTLFSAIQAVERVHRAVAPSGPRVSFDTVGMLSNGPAYVALAPTPRGLERRPADYRPRSLDAEAMLGPVIRQGSRALQTKRREMLDSIAELAPTLGRPDAANLLTRLLDAIEA